MWATAACEPLYAEMDRRGVVCFMHPTIPAYFPAGLNLQMWPAYLEYAFDTTRVAANLIYHAFMRKYPAIKWLLAHAGGTLPYLSMRLRLMEELETKGRKPPFPGLGAGRPFNERVPEGVAPYLDKFYFDVALSGADAPMAALTALAPATASSTAATGRSWKNPSWSSSRRTCCACRISRATGSPRWSDTMPSKCSSGSLGGPIERGAGHNLNILNK